MSSDWLDALSKLKEAGNIPEASDPDPETTPASAVPLPRLRILIDRKGRRGKTATIIEGFTCDDTRLKEIAATLKKHTGTGGSSRGSEILLQGDCKDTAAALLRDMGYKVTIV